ncbi:hypothetical protein [Thermosyntropha sp.]|uniref:hypothetical protein n=1 Tax=Thermosyntropha sp. TaxID=2740820 RepID=UPI0025FA3F08|nr:hypothetical protein [Thermosyntropha sp.]MBO8159236.1 hypothetical protein [Thermosyntropha sp.]
MPKRFFSILNEDGITLLEMLIAVAFLAFIAAAGFSVFYCSGRAFAGSGEKAELQFEMRNVMMRIASDIKESLYLKDVAVKVAGGVLEIEKREDVNGTMTEVLVCYYANNEGQIMREVRRLQDNSLVYVMPLTEKKVVPIFTEKDGDKGFYEIKLEGVNEEGRTVYVLNSCIGRRSI